MSRLKFKLEATAPNSKARASSFTTLHGEIRTPVFMPVGTQATVRGIPAPLLKSLGSTMLLANTYHLLLRPGPEVFERFGGIHRFMNWSGSVLSDSGGFQIFSLPHSRQMVEEGAWFQSYVDGKRHLLSPEKSVAMQKSMGTDIMMVLDQCVASTAPKNEAKAALELTARWAKRSLDARGDSPQSIFAIVQGACYPDLRRESAGTLTQLPFDGFAIGGLAVGESKEERDDFTELSASLLPENLPRYLMGVGTPLDILEGVHRGVDMFDCILPVALAQRGVAFTSQGKVQLRRSVYKFSDTALDPSCPCETCRSHSRAYLHHLVKTDEVLGWQLLGQHNLSFYHRLMAEMREAIFAGTFYGYYLDARDRLDRDDEDNPAVPTKRRLPKNQRRSRLGDYEVVPSAAGFCSIRQISSGEVMHSVNDPTEEAESLYVVQSGLAGALRPAGEDDPGTELGGSQPGPVAGRPFQETDALVVWDVGLGAGHNAMAALSCFEAEFRAGPGRLRPFLLLSFERDLDPLRLATANAWRFPHLRHPAPPALLKEGRWTHPSGLFEWRLSEGDFLERFPEAPRPALVFYDPFSYKTDSPLWTPGTFGRLFKKFGKVSGGESEGAVRLYTYSASTAVRASLLAAGFFVARGRGSGPKGETTVALYLGGGPEAGRGAGEDRLSALEGADLLDGAWLERWERSDARVPPGLEAGEREIFEAKIRNHHQFAGATVDLKPVEEMPVKGHNPKKTLRRGTPMNYRELGKTGYKVSELSFGAWAIGGSWGEVDDAESVAALHRALDLGVNFIDTADVYGDGRSERLVARVCRERGERPYVATKAGRRLDPHVASGYNKANLRAFAERSLKNLERDSLDLLQLHCPPTEVYYLPETFSALDDLVAEGKIRHYGVSVEKVEEALKAIEYPGVKTVQIIYNLFRRRPEDLFFREAERKKIGVLARVPLASGLLSGKITGETVFQPSDHRAYNRRGESFDRGETFAGLDFETGLEAVKELKALVPAGMSLAQFALRWILMNPAVTCAIPGAKRPSQAEENFAAGDFPALSPEILRKIDTLYESKIKALVHHYW